MGYTHYWSLKGNKISQTSFNKIAKDVKTIEQYFVDNDVRSYNAGGYYESDENPFVKLFDNGGESLGVHYDDPRNEYFSLNGDCTGNKEFGHESFSIQVGENTWTFCKTARKPYDLAVTLILLCLKYHLKSTRISSDGNITDWNHAIDLFGVIFPKRQVIVMETRKGFQVVRIPVAYLDDPEYKKKMQGLAYSPYESNTDVLLQMI